MRATLGDWYETSLSLIYMLIHGNSADNAVTIGVL